MSRAVTEVGNEWCVTEFYYYLIEIQIRITLRKQLVHRNWNQKFPVLRQYLSVREDWSSGTLPQILSGSENR